MYNYIYICISTTTTNIKNSSIIPKNSLVLPLCSQTFPQKSWQPPIWQLFLKLRFLAFPWKSHLSRSRVRLGISSHSTPPPKNVPEVILVFSQVWEPLG